MGKSGVGIGSLVGLMVIMATGVFMYQRIWSVYSDLSDARRNAAQLEHLYNEALDEAADWRKKYDVETKKLQDYLKSVNEATQTLHQTNDKIKSLEVQAKSLRKDKDNLTKEVLKLELLLKQRSKCDKLNEKEV
eukprot:c22034_g1_i3 orf=127-528(+)